MAVIFWGIGWECVALLIQYPGTDEVAHILNQTIPCIGANTDRGGLKWEISRS